MHYLLYCIHIYIVYKSLLAELFFGLCCEVWVGSSLWSCDFLSHSPHRSSTGAQQQKAMPSFILYNTLLSLCVELRIFIKMILVDMMSDILVLNISSLIHLNYVYINRMSKKGRGHLNTFQILCICGRSCCNVFSPLIWVCLYLHFIFACPVIAASLYGLTTKPLPRCRLNFALWFSTDAAWSLNNWWQHLHVRLVVLALYLPCTVSLL